MDLLLELKHRRLLVPANRMVREGRTVPSGLPALDRVCKGGLPVGAITEVVAPSCGGATVLYAALAGATSRGGMAALVDPEDGFDVASACAMGVTLERLLWVRPQGPLKKSLQALERILSSGGFALAALDLGAGGGGGTQAPPAAWMRLKKLAASSGTVVLVICAAGRVGTFASLAVSVRRRGARWGGEAARERWLERIELAFDLRRKK